MVKKNEYRPVLNWALAGLAYNQHACLFLDLLNKAIDIVISPCGLVLLPLLINLTLNYIKVQLFCAAFKTYRLFNIHQ